MNAPEVTKVEVEASKYVPGYQVLITSMFWNPESVRNYRSKYDSKRELPSQMSFEIPEGVLDQAKKKGSKEFNDVIETYIYNSLTHKFGHELNSAQIWLPEEK